MGYTRDALRAWGRILTGHHPFLSIEITRACPLSCPGCYAYEAKHLNELGPLIELSDYNGKKLIDGVLNLVQRYRPVYVSIVGGEPLVRYRELDVILPEISKQGITTMVVTSAVREIPKSWRDIERLRVAVSIDGLQPEHDVRRAPATYDRILKSISGHTITVHCTVTGQMARRLNYFEDFLTFWSDRPEVNTIWFSLFTPQKNVQAEEILAPNERIKVLKELAALRTRFPKMDMSDSVVEGYLDPPRSPSECVFSRANLSITADLRNRITPCQLGGEPDCSQCGCMASAGMKSVGGYRVMGLVPMRSIFDVSERIGRGVNRIADRDHR
jgi:sulfatase maturation enzyme AslB (radical SAM superfamily)